MNTRTALLLLTLLLSACFSLAAWLQPRSLAWRGPRAQADTLLKALLGDGRRMFANHFFTKADVYLHSGYYPSIFDQAKLQCENHLAGHEHDAHGSHEADEHEDASEHGDEHELFSKPRDWLERFRWRFQITEHTHLSGGGTEREVLPWLKLSAELDPQQVETYTVAAYWLRHKLGKPAEAEAFLREGLRANPDSHELLFELGRLCLDNHKDANRARNLWERALQLWHRNESGKPDPDTLPLQRILTSLARLEEETGKPERAIAYLRQLREASPHPDVINKQIEELQAASPKP